MFIWSRRAFWALLSLGAQGGGSEDCFPGERAFWASVSCTSPAESQVEVPRQQWEGRGNREVDFLLSPASSPGRRGGRAENRVRLL